MSHRLLMICYDFPPVASPGAQRAEKLVKYLPLFGWEPTVVAARAVPARRLELPAQAADPSTALVHLVPTPEADKEAWYRLRTKGHPDALTRSPMTSIGPVLGGRLWQHQAVAAGRRLAGRTHFDAVFATGHPMRSLVAGSHLSQVTKLPLVLELRDPWIGPGDADGTSSRRIRRERNLEAATILGASHTVAISPQVAELLTGRYPEICGRIAVLPNGFDPDDFEPARRPTEHQRSGRTEFLITSHGSVYGQDICRMVFRTLSRLMRANPDFRRTTRLLIVGGMPQENINAMLAGIEPRPAVEAYPRVSRRRSIQMMMESDVVIQIGHASPEVFGAKLFDYLASGTPVVTVVPVDSPGAQLVTGLQGGGAVSPGDDTMLARVLGQLWEDWNAGRASSTAAASDLAEYSYPRLTECLSEILNAVSAGPEIST